MKKLLPWLAATVLLGAGCGSSPAPVPAPGTPPAERPRAAAPTAPETPAPAVDCGALITVADVTAACGKATTRDAQRPPMSVNTLVCNGAIRFQTAAGQLLQVNVFDMKNAAGAEFLAKESGQAGPVSGQAGLYRIEHSDQFTGNKIGIALHKGRFESELTTSDTTLGSGKNVGQLCQPEQLARLGALVRDRLPE